MDYYYIWNKERTQLISTLIFHGYQEAVRYCDKNNIPLETVEIVEGEVE